MGPVNNVKVVAAMFFVIPDLEVANRDLKL